MPLALTTPRHAVGNCDRGRVGVQPICAAQFSEVWKRTSRTFGEYDRDQRIEAAGRALTLDDYLLTRLMSVTAHGVNVAITLSRRPWTTRLALTALRPVLVDLLGEVSPIGWTDADLLEIGTGRRPLTTIERDAAGCQQRHGFLC